MKTLFEALTEVNLVAPPFSANRQSRVQIYRRRVGCGYDVDQA